MKKIIKIIILLLFLKFNLNAEGTITVIDQLSKKPLQNASVHFSQIGSKTKTAVRKTDKSGKTNNPFDGKTQVLITFIGYHNIMDTINSVDKTYSLIYKEIEMDEVIVTGNFKPTTNQKSIYDIKVINQEKIENNASSTLRELLLTESNIRLDQDNVLGSSIKINGISGENVKIMVDGVPLIGRLNGNIDVSQINLNNIKRVEIVEGPMSSIYGSDALGGVINLISKEPNCEKTEIDLNSYYESVGSYKFNASGNYSISNFNLLLSGGRDLFQGYDPVDTSRNVKWNPKEQYFANLQASMNFDKQTVRYQSAFFREFVLNRGDLIAPYKETAFDDKYYTNRWTNSLLYNAELTKNVFIDITSAYSYYHRIKNTFFKNMLDLSEKLTVDPADQDTSNFYTFMIRPVLSHDKLFQGLNYQVGLDINMDIAEGKKIQSGKKSIEDYAAFISLQYEPIQNMLIQPSLRIIKNSIYEAPIVPALNFKYDFDKNFTFRASYAKGFRAPSIKELFYEFVDINHNIHGNDSLKAETSDAINASLNFKMSDNKYYFSVEPKFFYNSLDNMITLASITDVLYKNVNIGKYETIGGNITLKYIRENISTTFIYSRTGRMNQDYETTKTSKYDFSNEVSLNFDYTIPWIESKLNLYYKYTGRMPSFMIKDNVVQEYFIEDYNMMDANLSRKFFDIFDFTLGVKNLFDVKDIKSNAVSSGGVHTPSSIFPIGWGRTFFINLKIKVL